MADLDDEYERERQENIRKNQELLLSLGLNSSTSANATAREKKRREVESKQSEERDYSPGRSSARLSSRPRRSYAPPPKKKKKLPAPQKPLRLGSRRSDRLSKSNLQGNGRRSMKENDSDVSSPSRSPPIATLKRLKNPLPPAKQSVEDYVEEEYESAPLPYRDLNGNIIFENNNRHFKPNLTPEEMLRGGIFGGTAFRPYFSSVLGQELSSRGDLTEFPASWYRGLDEQTKLTSSTYNPAINRFRVKAGQSLEEWEKAGWVRRQDPRGWWQWYFRFYLGRRTSDDARQIGRFNNACGPSGRFKRSLVTKIHNSGTTFDDESISPIIRQTLFHWGYQLTRVDYEAYF